MKRVWNTVIATLTFSLVVDAFASEYRSCPEGLEPIVRPLPEYPTNPVPDELDEWVLVEFVISQDGSTDSAIAIESSSPRFERSAVRAVLKTRYAERATPCTHRLKIRYVVE